MSQEISAPIVTEDVTPEWLSQILGVKISAENFHITPNAHAGSGYLSNLLRVSCQQEDESKKPVNLIVKLLPPDGSLKDLIISQGFDKSEINFYRVIIPDLIAELPELEKYFCTFLGGVIQEENVELNLKYSSVMVLTDLKSEGYFTISFAQEMTQQHMATAVEFMAKFHFAGMAVIDKRKSSFGSEYPFLQNLKNDGIVFFADWLKSGVKEVYQIFGEKSTDTVALKCFQELEHHARFIVEMLQSVTSEFPCMIHGDLWSNNFLFSDDPAKSFKVIDWQLAGYQDPTFDLAVLLVSSLPMDYLKPEYIEKYLNLYYDTFVEYAKKSGSEHLIQRDRQTFANCFYTYAMSYTYIWFSMASDPFSTNFPRYVRIYEFLHNDMHVPKFLMEKINASVNNA